MDAGETADVEDVDVALERRQDIARAVVKAFAEKDLDEEIALKNARLAKILTFKEYDLGQHEPILWTPSDASN